MFFKGGFMSNPDEYKDDNQNWESSEPGEFDTEGSEWDASGEQNPDYDSSYSDENYDANNYDEDGNYIGPEYAEGDYPADGISEQTEYAEGDYPGDGISEQTEYAEGDYPADEFSETAEYAEDGYSADDEEKQKEPKQTLFQKIRNADRYTVVLFMTLMILLLGVFLLLIRLGFDYGFIIQPKFKTEGFGYYQQNEVGAYASLAPVSAGKLSENSLIG